MLAFRERFRGRSWQLFLVSLVLILFGVLIGRYFYATGEVQYYVSPTGHDANPGTFEAPFKTVSKAISVLRGTSPGNGATVFLRGGEYEIAQTIGMGQADSGLTGAPIKYVAYQGEKPIIDGTVDIPELVLEGGNVYKADLDTLSGIDFRTSGISDLTWNGAPQPLARYPNYREPNLNQTDPWVGQFAFAAAGQPASRSQIKYSGLASNPANWSNVGSGARAVVFSGPNYWDSTVEIASVDTVNSLLMLNGNASYDIVPGNRFWVENSKEFLDSNGEWFYDKGSNQLYLYLDTAPTASDVFSAVRAGELLAMTDVSNVTIEGLVLRGSSSVAINVRATNLSKNLQFIGNEISVTGREAIRIAGKAENFTVDRNVIHDTGWQGIIIEQDSSYFKTLTSANHVVSNNVVSKVGRKWRANAAIDIRSIGTAVAHNEVFDTPRMGLYFRGNDNVFEFNKVYRTNLETQDTGAIYGFGRSWLTRGNVVRNNYFKDTGGYGLKNGAWVYPNYSYGVYFDDLSSGNTAENNVVVRAAQAGVLIHGGRDNTVRNNFFIDSQSIDSVAMIGQKPDSVHVAPMWTEFSTMEQLGYDRVKYLAKYPQLNALKQNFTELEIFGANIVERNIIYNVNGADQHAFNSRRFAQSTGNVADFNLYWSTKLFTYRDDYTGQTLAFPAWQALGMDTSSLIVDPGFVQMNDEGYKLAANSPAVGLGISPIDVSQTGPVRETVTTPIVTITAPAINQAMKGTFLLTAAVADSTDLKSVTFKVDGKDIGSFAATGPYQQKLSTIEYADGLHSFTVVAINQKGGVGSAAVEFIIGNTVATDRDVPTVLLQSPAAGAKLLRATKMTAVASDNSGVLKVEFVVDGQVMRTVVSPPYLMTWNPRRASKGNHTVILRAYDAAGNVGISEPVTISR